MKAISIRQPYAELIASGRKTLEIRSWSTDYRGPLLIVASAQPWRDECESFGIRNPSCGAAICVVQLQYVRPFKRADAAAACCDWSRGLLAWELALPRRVEPIAVKGRLRLYDVDDSLIKIIRPDVRVTQGGPGFFTLTTQTARALAWIERNTNAEPYEIRRMEDGAELCLDDARMAADIVDGMRDDGLTVEVSR